jgi:hypothetical protein
LTEIERASISNDEDSDGEDSDNEDSDDELLSVLAARLMPGLTSKHMIELDADLETSENFNSDTWKDDIVQSVIEDDADEEEEEEQNEEPGSASKLISFSEANNILKQLIDYCREECPHAVGRLLLTETELISSLFYTKKQTNITNYFNKE